MAPIVPQACYAVVLEDPGAPRFLSEIPVEPYKHGEVLIKVYARGVCGSDAVLQQGAFGEGVKLPIIPGHALDSEEAIEFAGKQGAKCMIEKSSFEQSRGCDHAHGERESAAQMRDYHGLMK